ncbi:MAG: cupredoxin domain-containing protein [Acidimicrobiia bacterium]
MTAPPKSTFLALLVGLSLILAGCGNGGSGDVTTTAASNSTTSPAPPVSLEGQVNDHGQATVEGGSIEVELDNFYFDPTFIAAEPGATVEVELTNKGTTSHTFTVESQNIDIELKPGQSETVEVTIPQSGNLNFFCRFHVGQGMQGAFFPAGG